MITLAEIVFGQFLFFYCSSANNPKNLDYYLNFLPIHYCKK